MHLMYGWHNNYGWEFSAPVVFMWTGEGSDNNWSTGANWQGGVVPDSSDIAAFSNVSIKNVTIDTNINIAGMIIGSGYLGR